MSKSLVKGVAWCETKVWNDNSVTIKIIGANTKGSRVEIELDKQPTYILSHIADEIAQALVKVRDDVQNDINTVRRSLD